MRTYTHGVIGYLLYAQRPRHEQRLAVMGSILPDVFLALGFVAYYAVPVGWAETHFSQCYFWSTPRSRWVTSVPQDSSRLVWSPGRGRGGWRSWVIPQCLAQLPLHRHIV